MKCGVAYQRDGTSLSAAFLGLKIDLGAVSLYNVANQIQLIFPLTIVAPSVIFFLSFGGLVYMKLNLRHKSEVGRRKLERSIFKYFLWTSVALNIAVAAGTQQAANGLQIAGDAAQKGSLQIVSGKAVLALQWLIVVLSLIFAWGSRRIYQEKDGKDDKTTSAVKNRELGAGAGGGGGGGVDSEGEWSGNP